MNFEDMSESELRRADEEIWEESHPHCESCRKRGCAHGCCVSLDGLVMLTDGLVFHSRCLAAEQAADAAFGNVEYRCLEQSDGVPVHIERDR